MGIPRAVKKPANLTLDAALLAEARTLGLNISAAAEAGLRAAVEKARAERWREENAAALKSSNEWVEAHGLPLQRHRPF
jgi:antitoxin CcdA